MMPFAVLAIVKATLVCGVAFFLSRVCRRARASIRHLLFALAFASLAAIPGAGTIVPTVAVTLPATAAVPAARTEDMASAVLSSADADASGSGADAVSRDAATPSSITIAQVIAASWLVGVSFLMIPVIVGLWQVRCLRQMSSPWIDGQALVQTLAPTLGVHRRVDTLLHESVTGPMTCGLLKPAIILPAAAEQWDETTLRCALRHELEHVVRWDFLTHCVSRTVCAAYWFHPLVWAAWRRLRLEAERACDDAVLREDDATDYASLLVSIAQRAPADARQPLLTMAGRHELAARVAAVLDNNQSRGRVGRRRATGLIATWAIAAIGVASITVARAVPQTQEKAASIKRNAPSVIKQVDGRMVATNVTLRELLIFAYGVRDVESAPGWVHYERFDIVATTPFDTFRPQQGSTMMRSFLAERFKLSAHRGLKEFPIYALVRARPDGSLGPRMTRSQIDCRSKPGESSRCGLSGTAGRLAGGGVTTAQLASLLPKHADNHRGRIFDRELIDRTRLSGRFDFRLDWTPDQVAPTTTTQSGPPQFRPFASHLESNAPRLLAALEEQLGLKIDSQLTPKPVLVIDKVERPAEN